MENVIEKVGRWMLFIPTLIVALIVVNSLLLKAVDQAFILAPTLGWFFALFIPGLIVWVIACFFIHYLFKSVSTICPSLKGAKYSMIGISLIISSITYGIIIHRYSLPFYQEIGILMWIHHLYSFTVRGARERVEESKKEQTPGTEVDLLDEGYKSVA